ncbi:nucleoside-triphosphatase, partial [Thermofilum sp.]
MEKSNVKNFLVTGRPGIGKTTCVIRIAEILTSRGVTVG